MGRLKMFTARFTQFKHSAAAILHSLIILFIVKNRNVEPFTQFHSSVQLLFKRSSSKEPLTRTCISLFSAEKPFQGFQPKTPFVHHPPPSSQFILFRLFGAVSVKCCESFAYVAPFDVSLYILKIY